MHLKIEQRHEIVRLYKQGGTTYQKLADQFGVSKQTVYRILNNLNKKVNTAAPKKNQAVKNTGGLIEDPIEFRRKKLIEIQDDIITMRERGSAHALPALHRLHVTLHEEYITLRDEMTGDEIINPDELIHNIAHAVKNLPPILKDRLIDLLDDKITTI